MRNFIKIISFLILFSSISQNLESKDKFVGGGISFISPLTNNLSDDNSYLSNGFGLDAEAQFEIRRNGVLYLGLSWFSSGGNDTMEDSLDIRFDYSAFQIELGGKYYFSDMEEFTAFAGAFISYSTNTSLNTTGSIEDIDYSYIELFNEFKQSFNIGLSVGISIPVSNNNTISLDAKAQTFQNSIFRELTKITLKYNFNLGE